MSKILNEKELLYCIFEVWSYKGGELCTDVNLSYDSFIDNLTEKVDSNLYEVDIDTITLPELQKEVHETINRRDFQPLYAGADIGFCGKLFKIEDGELVQVYFSQYVEDIAKRILEWAQDD